MKETKSEELKKLRKTVREFLLEIHGVPFRAVDCDQDKAERLFERLARLSGFRW